MKTISHYLKVYRLFVSTSFSMATSFRLNFFLLILMDLFFYFSTLATVSIIYDHVQTIGPWSKEQLMFFTSFMLCVDHLHMTLLSESFWVFSRDLKIGNIDFVLLKPISSIFTIFFRYVRPSSLCNIFVIWACVIYYGRQIDLTILAWIALPLLVILSFILLAILEIIISTSMFWMTEGMGINFLRMQMQNLSRWPDFIYSKLSRRVLKFAIPILIIGSAPVHFLLDQNMWHYLIYLLVAIAASFIIMVKLWSFALRQYESASS
ncbi:ABC transporter permease [Halobacteriovorax sp. HLS]|uniref:ABC transporter permease n=1 Tax=Halobacteriovorax sp. HLS TaxID=2234000 RepID=UPI000FD6EC2D|nr:ABC-2 family transporter protein [Halobacteriovorax sp. HLS]